MTKGQNQLRVSTGQERQGSDPSPYIIPQAATMIKDDNAGDQFSSSVPAIMNCFGRNNILARFKRLISAIKMMWMVDTYYQICEKVVANSLKTSCTGITWVCAFNGIRVGTLLPMAVIIVHSQYTQLSLTRRHQRRHHLENLLK